MSRNGCIIMTDDDIMLWIARLGIKYIITVILTDFIKGRQVFMTILSAILHLLYEFIFSCLLLSFVPKLFFLYHPLRLSFKCTCIVVAHWIITLTSSCKYTKQETQNKIWDAKSLETSYCNNIMMNKLPVDSHFRTVCIFQNFVYTKFCAMNAPLNRLEWPFKMCAHLKYFCCIYAHDWCVQL